MNRAVEQVLLYLSAVVILSTTLIVFILQFVRMRRRGRDGDGS